MGTPANQAPGNTALNHFLKNPQKFEDEPHPRTRATAPTLTSDHTPNVSTTSQADFSQVHLESQSNTPSSRATEHERRERNLGREKSVLMKKYGKIDLELETARKKVRQAEAKGDPDSAFQYEKKLRSLKARKRELGRQIEQLVIDQSTVTSADTSSSDDGLDIASPYKPPQQSANEIRTKIDELNGEIQREIASGNEKKADRLRQEADDLQQELKRIASPRSAKKVNAPSFEIPARSSMDAPKSNITANDMLNYSKSARDEKKKELRDGEIELSALKRDNADDETINACAKAVRALQHEVKVLDALIAQLASATSSPDKSLTATLTRRGRPPAPFNLPSDTSQVSRLTSNTTDARRSSLLLGNELKKLFSPEGIKELDKIEGQIQELEAKLEEYHHELKHWTRQVDEASHSFDLPDFESLRDTNESRLLATTLRLAQLIEKRKKLENLVFPAPSIDELNKARAEFLERFKSEKTRQLENVRKTKLAALEQTMQSDWRSSAMFYLSGLTAFAGSFMWGNGLSRAPYLGSSVLGSVVSAALHVTVAGPVVKQLLWKSWSAPAFIEFNTYVKLIGSKWGDEVRGETGVRKYQSKYPDHAGLLTIEERLAEEKPLSEILWSRMNSEDAAYFFYAMNYLGKAAIAAGIASSLAPVGVPGILTELALHTVLGGLSGAFTVAGIQNERSKHPKSELKAVPTREIFAAEADEQESLLADLIRARDAWLADKNKSPDDTTGVDLIREIGKTQKALEAARTKSKFLGTFRYEFANQFTPGDPLSDTVSEMLGRWISLWPTTIASELLRDWRKSGDPKKIFAGHAIPAVLLILPPGFSARAIYSGLIRASIQQHINGRAGHLAASGVTVPEAEAAFTGNPTDYDRERQDWM